MKYSKTTLYNLKYEDLCCEECGDSVTLVGHFETDEEQEELKKCWEIIYRRIKKDDKI